MTRECPTPGAQPELPRREPRRVDRPAFSGDIAEACLPPASGTLTRSSSASRRRRSTGRDHQSEREDLTGSARNGGTLTLPPARAGPLRECGSPRSQVAGRPPEGPVAIRRTVWEPPSAPAAWPPAGPPAGLPLPGSRSGSPTSRASAGRARPPSRARRVRSRDPESQGRSSRRS